jgi:general secretion pathway protein C
MTGNPLVSHTITQASSRNRTSFWQKGVISLLIVLLVVFLGRLVLVIVTAAPSGIEGGQIARLDEPEQAIDIAILQAGQIFGPRTDFGQNFLSGSTTDNSGSSSSEVETALNLRLEGVVVGSQTGGGFAMISGNAGPGTYRVGGRLLAGNRVVLDQIYADRVILENNGSMETLWLYDDVTDRTLVNSTLVRDSDSQVSLQAGGVLPTGSYNPDALVNEYRERFQNNALSAEFLTLSEIVKVSPEHINGQLQGYRLSPGENLKEFVQLGFITNDILTQLNGIELNDMSNLPGLFGELTTASNVTLSLLREGKPVNLELSLAELQKK